MSPGAIVIGALIFTTRWAILADDKFVIFYIISLQKTGFDILCKLSPLETICMKCQILFSGKNKENILGSCAKC